MNAQETRILTLMQKVLPFMPEFEKGRMLGMVETMNAMNNFAPARDVPDRTALRPRA
ncbi:MAG: hypothetical protein IJT94_12715 [Oscillibacter sp.]|nr:hypothetical protein [Oscillibacter sp.]